MKDPKTPRTWQERQDAKRTLALWLLIPLLLAALVFLTFFESGTHTRLEVHGADPR